MLVTTITALLAASSQLLQAAEPEPDEGLEEIQVTGSRIRSVTSMSTPTPVTAITADELKTFNPGSTVATARRLGYQQ